MHYYSHNIKEFRAGCHNLESRLERWIYRDMIDVYYDREKPFPDDLEAVCDMLGLRRESEREIVSAVLRLKFKKTEEGWISERCEVELASYREKLVTASGAGKASAAAKKLAKEAKIVADSLEVVKRPLNDRSTTVDDPLNITSTEINALRTNQEPITKEKTNTPIPPEGGDRSSAKKSAIALKTYLADCKAAGSQAIPADSSVFDYAAEAKIPEDFLLLQWLEFRDRYSEEGAKRYKAWPIVFSKSVRGNWFKLWYFDREGTCTLTTTGIQAQNTHEARK